MDCAFIFNRLCRALSLFGMCLFHLSGIAKTRPWDSQGITERSNRGIAECLAGAKRICSRACPYPPIPFPAHRLCAPAVVSGGKCNISLTYKHAIGINPPTCANAHNHFMLHISSLLLDPLFIALVVIKCAMCMSIQSVCTPEPSLLCPAKLLEPPMLATLPLALHTATMLLAALSLI